MMNNVVPSAEVAAGTEMAEMLFPCPVSAEQIRLPKRRAVHRWNACASEWEDTGKRCGLCGRFHFTPLSYK